MEEQPSWALVTSLLGNGGSPLLISTGVRQAELVLDPEGKVIVGVDPNSLMWSNCPPLAVRSKTEHYHMNDVSRLCKRREGGA